MGKIGGRLIGGISRAGSVTILGERISTAAKTGEESGPSCQLASVFSAEKIARKNGGPMIFSSRMATHNMRARVASPMCWA